MIIMYDVKKIPSPHLHVKEVHSFGRKRTDDFMKCLQAGCLADVRQLLDVFDKHLALHNCLQL
jgi:hypothetical protein